jgi:hypothetical protein
MVGDLGWLGAETLVDTRTKEKGQDCGRKWRTGYWAQNGALGTEWGAIEGIKPKGSKFYISGTFPGLEEGEVEESRVGITI